MAITFPAESTLHKPTRLPSILNKGLPLKEYDSKILVFITFSLKDFTIPSFAINERSEGKIPNRKTLSPNLTSSESLNPKVVNFDSEI